MHRKGRVISGILGLLATGLFAGLGLAAKGHDAEPVGLSLLFQNSAMAPVTLVGSAPRYLQEIDLVASVPTPGDQGILAFRRHPAQSHRVRWESRGR